jgi:hypothetical protein
MRGSDGRPRSEVCALREASHPTRAALTLHTHTQTVHNRACGSLAARTDGGLAVTHRPEPRHTL